MARGRIEKDLEGFKKIVAESNSVADVIRKMEYKDNGGIYFFLKKKFEKHNIDTSHFTGKAWNKGKRRETDESVNKFSKKLQRPWGEIFKKGSDVKNIDLLRRLLISGKRDYKCEECGIQNWQGEPIRLQIDHINGDNTDNREANLKILCPNCHSQTETYAKGKNRKADKNKVSHWWKELSVPPEKQKPE